MIKEIIVVEGRDDVIAVKNAVDAEVIPVGGFGINGDIIELIKEAQKRRGVIVFTDPDFAGEKIRGIISKRVAGIKHAYIVRGDGLKKGNIGVENASKDVIIKALKNAKPTLVDVNHTFSIKDMVDNGLTVGMDSTKKREKLGKILGIGSCNSKQFINRLNKFGISKEEFYDAIREMEMGDKCESFRNCEKL